MVKNLCLKPVVYIGPTWSILESGIASFAGLFPFPHGSKVNFALGTPKRLLGRQPLLILGQIINNMFQSKQIHKFRVARIRDEIHFWRWGFRRWNLMEAYKQMSPLLAKYITNIVLPVIESSPTVSSTLT
jgi:hypothetical protein